MTTGGYDVIVKFGADLTALNKGFSEAGTGATGLDNKVKNLSSSTSSINVKPVQQLKSDFENTTKSATGSVGEIKNVSGALGDIKKVDAFDKGAKDATNFKSVLQSTSKEARGLNTVMKAFGDSGSPMLKELSATTRLGAAFTGDAQGAGLLSVVMGSFGGILLPVIAIVAAIAAAFAILYATSATFRDVIGQIVKGIMQVVGWVQTLVGDLTSGNFSKFGDDFKAGILGAFNVLKTFDYGSIGKTIVKIFTESATTIGTAFLHAFDTLKSIDWGGLFAGALDAVDKFLTSLLNFDPTPMINSLIDAIGKAFDSLFGTGGKGDVGTSVSKGVQKAGPDILGKLGDVFLKLLALVPTIFAKIAIALFNALVKIDWGTVFAKLGGAISGALGGIDWGGIVGGFFKALGGAAVKLGAALLQALQAVNWLQVFTLIFVTIKSFGQALINGLKAIDWGGGLAKLWTAIQTVLGGLVNWLKSLDWGGFATTIWNFIKGGGALGMIVNWLKSLDWGGYAQTVWNALKGAIGAIIGWIKGLDWGGYAQTVYRALTGAIGAIIGWLISLNWGGVAATFYRAITGAVGAIIGWLTGLNWGGVAATFYRAITGAVGAIIGWLEGLDWGGIARTFYNAITGALGGLIGFLRGIDWGSVADTFFGKIKDALGGIVGFLQGIDWGSALGGIGNAIVNAIKGAWNATLGGKGFSFDTHIPEVGVVGFTIPTLAQGGILAPRTGGVPVIAAERGEPEMFVPQHDWGKPWESLLSSYPHFGGGGIIGSVPSTSGRSGNDGGASTTVGPTYVTYVTVDSEDITRKVFASFLDNERYNMLGRKGSF